MSDPAPSEQSKRPRYRYPEDLTPEQVAQLQRSAVVDAEAYLRWLETGEGSDPCAEFFD